MIKGRDAEIQRLLELEGEEFVTSVTGHDPASEAALTAIGSYGASLSLGG